MLQGSFYYIKHKCSHLSICAFCVWYVELDPFTVQCRPAWASSVLTKCPYDSICWLNCINKGPASKCRSWESFLNACFLMEGFWDTWFVRPKHLMQLSLSRVSTSWLLSPPTHKHVLWTCLKQSDTPAQQSDTSPADCLCASKYLMSSVGSVKVCIVASHFIPTLSSVVLSSSPLLASCYQKRIGRILCQAGLIGIHMIHCVSGFTTSQPFIPQSNCAGHSITSLVPHLPLLS